MKKSKKILAAVVAAVAALLAAGFAAAPALRDPGPIVGRFQVVETSAGVVALDTATGESWMLKNGFWTAIPGTFDGLVFFGKDRAWRISPFLNVETAAEYLEKKHASEQ